MNKIIYLDSAATMQMPEAVIAEQMDFMRNHRANAGRGVCGRVAWVDDMVVRVRGRVAEFMNANPAQVVFCAGATDALNRVVGLIGGGRLRVAMSDADHHSARLPWQMRRDTEILLWPLDENFDLDIGAAPCADVYVLTAMSNVMGRVQDVAALVAAARAKNPGAIIIADAAQYVVHEKIDAEKWGADFICWSGHKIGADTGLGVLYVREPNRWAPDKFGGGMVMRVDADNVIFNAPPEVYEAGTMPLTQIAGLSAAIDSIEENRPNLDLIKYMYDELSKIGAIRILTARGAALLTFVVDGMHVLDFGAMMGAHGICVRVGNMCASWMMGRLGVDGAVRISVGAQNTMADAVRAVQVIKGIVK